MCLYVIKLRLGGRSGTELQRLPCGGLRRAPTGGSTLSPSRCIILCAPALKDFDTGLQALPTEVKEMFLWRAILIMASQHPLVSCDHLL